MFSLLTAGIAPGLALLSFFYLKDKYESEPIAMVFKIFIFGALLVFPIMFIQYAFTTENVFLHPVSRSFILSGFFEEFFKWFILYHTAFKHSDFNERYDGIVYATAISLGFATVENIFYLMTNGIEFAFGRALLPVSSHALFGVVMGFYIGKAKFAAKNKILFFLVLSFFTPIVLHGVYDFILITSKEYWLFGIVPFMILLWINAMNKVRIANSLDKLNARSLNK